LAAPLGARSSLLPPPPGATTSLAEALRPDLTGMPDLITLAWLAGELCLPNTGRGRWWWW
jgi:hypothetical protein